MVLIIQVVVIILFLLLLFLLLYLLKKQHEQKEIREQRIQYVSFAVGENPSTRSLIVEHINRTYVLYYSYVVHTALNMFCKIIGLILSVASFAMQVLSDILEKCGDPYSRFYHPLMGISLSFLAVIFVIIIVYVKPHKRAAQYLNAWRSMNNQYYTGKPKGVDEHEAICPARQDEQTPAQEVGRRKTNALAGQSDYESRSKQEDLRP